MHSNIPYPTAGRVYVEWKMGVSPLRRVDDAVRERVALRIGGVPGLQVTSLQSVPDRDIDWIAGKRMESA